MEDDTRQPDESQELAALFALGTLEAQEAARLTARLQAGDAVADELRAFERVVQALGYGVSPVSPPAALRARLLARLQEEAAETATSAPLAAAPFILRAHEGVWDQGPAPGIVLRTLFLDAARQYATQLIRLAPGTQVEPHWHADAEECYVLEGSFSVDTSTFQVGDYVRMPAGSAHNTITSDTGCLLLVMASTRGAPQN